MPPLTRRCVLKGIAAVPVAAIPGVDFARPSRVAERQVGQQIGIEFFTTSRDLMETDFGGHPRQAGISRLSRG